jgi:hypothetical protein
MERRRDDVDDHLARSRYRLLEGLVARGSVEAANNCGVHARILLGVL